VTGSSEDRGKFRRGRETVTRAVKEEGVAITCSEKIVRAGVGNITPGGISRQRAGIGRKVKKNVRRGIPRGESGGRGNTSDVSEVL